MISALCTSLLKVILAMPIRFGTIEGHQIVGPPFNWDDIRRVIAWSDNLAVNTSTNPGGNNAFRVIHETYDGSLLNGITGASTWVNWPSTFYNEGYSYPDDPPGNHGRKLYALTNPTRPQVLLPVFLSELRDIPEMVRQVGRVGIAIRDGGKALKDAISKSPTQGAAAANLAFQFGWKPLVQDLWTMATFQDAVDKRKHQLEMVAGKKGLRRTIKHLGHISKTESRTWAGVSEYTLRGHVNYEKTVSGGVVWKETYPGSAKLPEGNIRRQLAGLTADSIALNVWEGLPWTWFADYFNNVGDLIQAGNRTIATPDRGWLKWTTVITASHAGTKSNFGEAFVSGGTYTQKDVFRLPVDATSSDIAQLPLLGAGQLSILGSLAVVKNRRILR